MRCTGPTTGCSRAPGCAAATSSGRAAVVVGYECDGCELTLVDGLPTGPDGFEVVATAPATPFDRHTTPLPLAPGGRYELEFHAERLGTHLPPDALRHGHAVLGPYDPGHGGHRRLHRLGLRSG